MADDFCELMATHIFEYGTVAILVRRTAYAEKEGRNLDEQRGWNNPSWLASERRQGKSGVGPAVAEGNDGDAQSE